jgi:hypothetical protein
METVRAPFPWFGGKSRAAHLIWPRFGSDVKNYVEPFFGSGAVLLNRPGGPGHTETVNDLDCFVSNFWRALAADPDAVAHYADWPINEADLHARHQWLVDQAEFRERMKTDPEFYDPKIAGWWVWGLCAWIGSGWCSGRDGRGVSRTLPFVGNGGRGVHRKLPAISNDGQRVHRKRPHLTGRQGIYTAPDIRGMLTPIAERLRRVRVCCGDFHRVLTPAVTTAHGVTAVLLDPPYADTANRCKDLYAEDSDTVAHAAREWAIANGDNPLFRIALCGYEGEHRMPDSWECVPWRATGGFSKDKFTNSSRERIWFSPHCLKPADANPKPETITMPLWEVLPRLEKV